MASDIQIVNISNFEKIQSFLNDSAYKEILENSETFNTRLCIERRLRMPFLDPQTGVAQTHCALFMKAKQRMPGFREGQLYTYPSTRWRKPKRQYLLHHQSYKAYQFRETHHHHHHHHNHNNHHHHHHQGENTASNVSVDGNSLGASGDNDSKDGHPLQEKEWYYEEMELPHPEDFEEEIESDMDFEESYSGRKKKRNRNSTKKAAMSGESTPKRGRKVGSKTRKNLDMDAGGGGGGGGTASGSGSGTSNSKRRTATLPPPAPNTSSSPLNNPEEPQLPVLLPEPKIPVEEPESSPKKTNKIRAADRGKAQPSPYCDFCLGDARENKKTNVPEELVSCSDCGRSGHPTCLQFTPNMIISVKRYRWQCIECKYCSICGTSDNDDQLLFCDDCDRGYHMYCLTPPLTTPPEGSWSCQLCMEEFHSGKK